MKLIKENCIIHVRVSSSKQSQSGESLEVQENVCVNIAEARGWNIQPNGKIFKESFSGRKNIRPVFEEILVYIKLHPGEIKFYLFRAIDRFTRAGSYSYETLKRELSKHGVEMVDSYGIIQPSKNTLEDMGFEYEWSKYSPSEITELVLANTAKGEVTNILTRTIGQEIRLTQQGYKVRQAQDGFLNKQIYVDGKKKVIQIPDPERAKFYIEMFTLRAQGALSDQEIVDRVNASGFRTKLKHRWDKDHERVIREFGGKPLTVKHLQMIIPRPIYCAIICEKWTRNQPVKAQYDGLVSIDTYNRANRGKVFIKEEGGQLQIMYNHRLENGRRRYTKFNPTFPNKNSVLCPFCKKPFMGSTSPGKSGKGFPTYHCSRKSHKYFGVPKKTFDEKVESFVKGIKIKSDYLDILEAVLLDKYHEREKEIISSSVAIHRNIADLKAEQASKLQTYVATPSLVIKSMLEKEIEDLEKQIAVSNTESTKIDVTEADIKQFIKDAKYTMGHLEELLINPLNPRAQENFWGLVFTELPTYEEISNGTPKLAPIFEINSNSIPSTLSGGANCVLDGTRWSEIEKYILRWKFVFLLRI